MLILKGSTEEFIMGVEEALAGDPHYLEVFKRLIKFVDKQHVNWDVSCGLPTQGGEGI